MRWGRIYIIPIESTLAVPPTCLQGAWHARSLQSKYAAAASSASRVRRWHRARTSEARLSKSWLALNLHLPAAQTVPATHVGGAPPCAARTCLLRSLRRRNARSSYCTLFNNRCVLSACSCVSQNTHGGLWPRRLREGGGCVCVLVVLVLVLLLVVVVVVVVCVCGCGCVCVCVGGGGGGGGGVGGMLMGV